MTNTLATFLNAPVQHVQVEGIRVAYRSFGQGPALVMVHGWPLSGVTYRGLVHELSRDFTCYVPDLPGAGQTPWHNSVGETFRGYARIVAGFVDALGLQQYALVGHDSGGAVARMVAAQHGQRVGALLLTNTEVPGHVSAVVKALQMAARLPGARHLFSLLLSWGAFRRSAMGFGGCFGDPRLIDGEFRQTLKKDLRGAIAIIDHADLDVALELEGIHRAIQAPALLVWGQDDPFFPVERARAMLPQFPQPARMEVIADTKLLVHEEAPRQVAELARPFLAEALQPRTRARASA